MKYIIAFHLILTSLFLILSQIDVPRETKWVNHIKIIYNLMVL